MADEDLSNKTEEPTPRRREKAREEGQVAKSSEVTASAVLLTGVIAMSQWGGTTAYDLREAMRRSLTSIGHVDLTLAPSKHVRRSHPPVLEGRQVPPRTHPSTGTRSSPASRSRHTPIVLYHRANPTNQLTQLPKYL